MKYLFSTLTMLKSKLFAILAVGLLAGPMASYAVPISTSVGDFDVFLALPDPESFNDKIVLLTSQVWWDDQDLAAEFAGLVLRIR